MSTEEKLRLTVAALLARTGERQADLAKAVELTTTALSRRQTGRAQWSLADVDRLSAHWGIGVPDLLTGITHAVDAMPADRLPTATTPAPTPATAPETKTAAALTGAAQPGDDRPQPQTTAPAVAPPDPAQAADAAPCVLCGAPTTARAAGHPQHMYGLCVGGQLPAATPAPTADTSTPSSVPSRRARPAPAEGDLGQAITGRVAEVLREHDGDTDATVATLIKHAVPDVMDYFARSRASGRYEHKDFPPTEEILRKTSQKGADAIWEGRPKWRNDELAKAVRADIHAPVDVVALDANAAYLAALKTRLPLGRLVHDLTGRHDPKKAGVHLIAPPAWDHTGMPSPLGARIELGDLWVTEPTLRLLFDCANNGWCDPPVIRESWTSGSTEALLEKLRRTFVAVRAHALAEGDTVTVEYIKSMYSKFVSTIGESSANREIRRPDWMHIIRSQAFANLWRRADRARRGGLTLIQMSGTDELHVAGDWRAVFAEGRGMAEMKEKDTYTIGGD